jgi:hypothetical protein
MYFFLFGASILAGRLILSDLKVGAVCLFTLMLYTFYVLGSAKEIRGLSWLLGGDFFNPSYGLIKMASYLASYKFNIPDLFLMFDFYNYY